MPRLLRLVEYLQVGTEGALLVDLPHETLADGQRVVDRLLKSTDYSLITV